MPAAPLPLPAYHAANLVGATPLSRTTGVPPASVSDLLGQLPSPEQESWLLQRLKMGQGLFNQQPRRVTSGAGPGAAWGLADAVRQMLGARMTGTAMEGLQGLGQQRLSARRNLFDLSQQEEPAGLGPAESQAWRKTSADRLRKAAMAASMSGDEGMEKFAETSLKQQNVDREYAALAQQIEHQNRQLKLEEEKETHAEVERKFGRGHVARTEQEWVTQYAPDLGGFTHTSKHTGEAWVVIPGRPPVQISKGSAPGQPSGMGGPAAAAASTGGVTPPYVKLNEHQAQSAVRGQAGATGLLDALSAGFPTTSTLRSIPQALSWKSAEHGFPQLTNPDDQARVAAWDAVFDPVARMRAGLRIPEEQMSRMRMELRPNPGESWDNHVAKTRRILETFRADASTLPPVKSQPILEELDRVEAMLPNSKAAYEAFNKNAVAKMRVHREGKDEPGVVQVAPPGSATALPGPGAPLRKGQKKPLADRLRSYGYE